MVKRALAIVFIGGFACVLMSACRNSKKEILVVENSAPEHNGLGGVELVHLYDIDVSNISLFGKKEGAYFGKVDFDNDGNLYLFDPYEGAVFVFDEKGRLSRSFGRIGQGPQEFDRPSSFFVRNADIYVFEAMGTRIKIVDLHGRYLSKRRFNLQNRLMAKSIGNRVYILRGDVDQNFTKLRLILSIEGDDFSEGEEIFNYIYPPGLGAPHYNTASWQWICLAENGEFYFPGDNHHEYAITKYGRDGRPEMIIKRPYAMPAFSEAARKLYFDRYGRDVQDGEREFPPAPPALMRLFQDHKRNLWALVGETADENGDPKFLNTVDVFSQKGKWLYSLKTRAISENSFFHDDRIFTIRLDPETGEQSIAVYEIRYR